MKRLLKIKEFFHLQKKREHVGGEDRSRPAKRPRRASLKTDNEPEPKLQSATSTGTPKSSSRRQKFLDLFEDEVAKDIVWWLPGRRGEAFALNRERFERELIKKKFQGQTFVNFLANLSRWGFRQMNIPSLSGRVLAFELSSQNVAGWRSGKRASGHDKSKKRARDAEHSSSSNIHIERTTTPLVSNLRHDGEGQRQTATAADSSLFDSIHLQQAQYLVQQEMSQNYVSLLWQELQRQLNVLFLQQGHSSLQTPQSQPQTHSRHRHHHHHHHNRHNNHIDQQTQQPASLAIADVAALLHQQQLQQQIAAANLYQVLTEPGRPANQQTILQELAEIHQQQLSNLTYQIVALVAANMDMENQNQQPQAPQPPLIQKILVKYLIALALLQLQQQQQNLEALRQERQAALAVVQSLDNATTGLAATTATATTSSTTASNVNTDVDTRRATVQQEEGRQLHNVSVTQMQQLLSDAAMLSLSRVHQLLLEAAVLVQPFSVAPTVAFEQPSPPAQPNISTPVEPTFPGTGLRLNLNGVSTQAPRATTAR